VYYRNHTKIDLSGPKARDILGTFKGHEKDIQNMEKKCQGDDRDLSGKTRQDMYNIKGD
jgi:hypothetical protein